MAISLNTNLHHPSLSCGTKLYSGLKLQSPCLFATGRPNLTADFFSRISESVQCGTRNSKPTRSRVGMMPIGTPRVPYRVPCEETWQWVDLWNALYQERFILLDNISMRNLATKYWQQCYTLIASMIIKGFIFI
ncbi:ATP-dependent Clp protease proteolytic subunit-related protein 2, chloroplastic-like isoform X2 [Gossypium arboreum]|uniref:ATP-dependent Clp protease proteolytic subunit-related protein 2, chloroplastic-like isoform X2 n=1 Tax=Gossypium arboreum TaxID=29729 RepID=UPI0022F19E5A|nr:ATP-dependent Clp protease proteolytic subunit-related protein 2, chloroplastic-like isoform X2 [Gossypium arboreum]